MAGKIDQNKTDALPCARSCVLVVKYVHIIVLEACVGMESSFGYYSVLFFSLLFSFFFRQQLDTFFCCFRCRFDFETRRNSGREEEKRAY